MLIFEIIPHVGIGPIRLGASRDEVRAAMGAVGFTVKHPHPTMDYFDEATILVEYGDDGIADYIGACLPPALTFTYRGTNVFDVPAEELFSLVAAGDGSGTHVFDNCGYCFPNQIVSLGEAVPYGDRLDGEQRMAWAQVGLGSQRYLAGQLARRRRRIS